MKIKQAVIYRLRDVKKSVISFYLIIFASYILLSILTRIESVHVTQMSSLEMATMIFLLCIGLNSFKPIFYLLVQNGVSRKTMFYSFMISMLVSSAVMAFIDSVIYSLVETSLGISSLFEQLYVGLYEEQLVVRIFVTFVWALCAYFAFGVIGYFISILYYRMNKSLKLIVSISVPCLLFIGLPIIDTYFNGKVTLMIRKTFDFFFGTGAKPNPFISAISCCCLSIIFLALSFGLSKKAVIKRS